MKFLARIGNIGNKFTKKSKQSYVRQRYINALNSSNDWELMALLLTVEDKKNQPELIFDKDIRGKILQDNPFDRYKKLQQKYAQTSLSDQMTLIDSQIILPDIFLEKVDKATMASSIEVRVPFLDNELVDFCLSLPAKIKIKNGIQKGLLKRSLEGIVPNEILYGKKMGFGVPFEYWIKTSLFELLNDHLSGFYKKYPNILSAKRISTLIFEHSSGKKDNGFLLWKLLNFVIWANNNNLEFSNNDIN